MFDFCNIFIITISPIVENNTFYVKKNDFFWKKLIFNTLRKPNKRAFD